MEKQVEQSIESLLKENRKFKPSASFKQKGNFKDSDIYKKSYKNITAFWEKFASELHWFKKWDKVLDWKPPFSKWFVNGKINISYNCLDRHIQTSRKNKAAIIWEGEPGDKQVLTYWDLYREVNKFANVLLSMGIKKGDRVALYMPMIPEMTIAMLACARIGAVHSVIFAGFSPNSIRDRINDSQCKLVVTADGGYRKGSVVQLKNSVDDALKDCPSVENVIIVKRGPTMPVKIKQGRDFWWHWVMQDKSQYCAPVEMDSEDILFILYTSGTTGKPKGIVHTVGGYLTQVYATMKMVFDIKEDDVFWCTADIGWITGHSYVVYGPLSNGATTLMYEGAPDWPKKNRFWQLIEKYNVNVFYTAPTAIRAFMKWGVKHIQNHDLSSLRLLGSVGEPINPEAWIWYHKYIGNDKCPIVDTWWQTETGAIMISPIPSLIDTKPGSATKAIPGIVAEVLNERGEVVKEGGGYLAIKQPWPSMLRGIWNNEKRYVETYWSKWKDVYFPGDGARIDEDGYFWLLGRVDDVINVAGHNLGTMEIESALIEHDLVAESAVIGKSHQIKGQVIVAYVVLKNNAKGSLGLDEELKDLVVYNIGKIAKPHAIIYVPDLPKTRSGKIMRRLLKDISEGNKIGDISTLSDPTIIEKLQC